MKPKSQTMMADGFDTNVAEKMPKIRKLEEPLHSYLEEESPLRREERHKPLPEIKPTEREITEKVPFKFPEKRLEAEQSLDVLNLIEDLHAQLLASAQTKRALEKDLVSTKRTIHQLSQDNQELHRQVEALQKEHQGLKEFQSESYYLQEENADALEKIKEFQQELRDMRTSLNQAIREKEEALTRIHELELQMEQNEVVKIKGKLKEKEASLFSEENRELQSRLDETLALNLDLEKKYETLKKSFHEVKESLTFLRDSCKTNYYNLSENPE